ncbi:DUF262 domain-containing protein [Intrasporangium calvum]|uniref:GmrSD restriction endonucleases N-terminal domain-containing protein n=1 Tax=Intrasporangium calvum (strain ATCC 23552 / DSM 43043 / JCM 3097 / NBRC 12989 / NCIMB 10167 / NRRL B-3866 / 7 KIP) TaxID=710696 RepID=E6SEK1_INTC7|nr:DUF262 domain-containing protein [Intrasporangium calvum]ADU46602.1 protein of unknown function DUF262 [Intrasporangium calvum DSM 43043]
MDFSSTQETIGWFRDRYLEGTLTLKPPYQRNPVWMARQKNHLVESVLMKMPIPEIFIQRSTDANGRTAYAVVDGQQRISALMQFIGSYSADGQEEFDQFPLDKLTTESDWYNRCFADLTDPEKISFFGYELAVRYLNSSDEEQMKAVFRRLNSFTVPLKPQELRHATYIGPFSHLADKLAGDYGDFFAENRIITVGAIRRMADVEFVAELLIGTMHGPQGGSAKIIDDYYSNYEDFEDEFPGQRKTRVKFEETMAAIERLFPDLRGSRWGNKSDFYSLFVALAAFLPRGSLSDRTASKLRGALREFEEEVEQRVGDEEAPVSKAAASYARGVVRAPNEKSRRAARHASLLAVLEEA